MSEVNLDKFVIRARSFGLNVFFGSMRNPLVPEVIWDDEQGDYVKFLKLAKDSGASIVVIDKYVIGEKEIEKKKIDLDSLSDEQAANRAKELNSALESFRQYVGKVTSASISWVKDGVEFTYIEDAPWANDYFSLLDEIEAEFGDYG